MTSLKAKAEPDDNHDGDINPPAANKPAFTATPFKWKDPSTLPYRGETNQNWVAFDEDINPQIMEYIQQAIDAKEVIEGQPDTSSPELKVANDNSASESAPRPATPRPASDKAGANDNTPAPPAFVFTPYVPIDDPAKLPRREYAFGTHYIRKYVSVTCAPGGLGKTSNSLVEALSMVSGKAST